VHERGEGLTAGHDVKCPEIYKYWKVISVAVRDLYLDIWVSFYKNWPVLNIMTLYFCLSYPSCESNFNFEVSSGRKRKYCVYICALLFRLARFQNIAF
jgi:hypothetical protein